MDLLEPHIRSGLGVSFMAVNDQYWTVWHYYWSDIDNIEASKATKDRFCVFVIEKVDDDTILLKSDWNGKYLSIYYRGNSESHSIEAGKDQSDEFCKFRVYNVDGKIVLKSVASGRYLSVFGRSGKGMIEAVKNGIDRYTKFVVETGAIAPVHEKILSISWGDQEFVENLQPSIVAKKTVVNNASSIAEQEVSLEWSLAKTSTTSWQHAWGVTAGVKYTSNWGGVAGIGFGNSLEISLQVNYNGNKGGSDATTVMTKIQQTTKVKIQSGKKVTLKLVVQMIRDASIPFVATIERTSEKFGVTTFDENGTWKGVLLFGSRVEITEEDL